MRAVATATPHVFIYKLIIYIVYVLEAVSSLYLEKHYRNLALCRVPNILPSAFFRALGKEALCRVPRKKPSVKENNQRRSSLSSVLFLTLGKEFLCRVSNLNFKFCKRPRI
jgi:hypothetical protein